MDNLDLDALRALHEKATKAEDAYAKSDMDPVALGNAMAAAMEFRRAMIDAWPHLLALVEAADELEGAGLRYRRAHDQYGDGDMKAGRAWDLWRRAQEKYAALRSGAPK